MTFGKEIGRNPEHGTLRDSWQTPPAVFAALDAVFRFTVDACADSDNHLVTSYWSVADDALEHDWSRERVFCNPPYSDVGPFLERAASAERAVVLAPITAVATRHFEA
jgi:phage N-6-adenine-methyltransferase